MVPPDGVGSESDENLSADAVGASKLDELNKALWSYRRGMDRIEFLLGTQLLFSGAGRDDRLSVIADLMDETAMTIGSLARQRDIMLKAGWMQPPSLEQAADWSGEPWSTLLRGHHEWLVASVGWVHRLVEQCLTTMGATAHLAQQLADLVANASDYDDND
ncbi:MAG: hypothetical protein O3C27_14350 [Actinomycetota bacterium]|nr:hypothetical protein [Actinomycetota bacterium]